jgi:hypothetical protein
MELRQAELRQLALLIGWMEAIWSLLDLMLLGELGNAKFLRPLEMI